MPFLIFIGVVFALGIFFIVQLSSLIEHIVKGKEGKEYSQQKLFCGVLFGIILVLIVMAGIST